MTTEEQKLRNLFHSAIVPTQDPLDRVAAVHARVRRSRIVGTGIAAAVVGAGLMVAVPAVSSWQGSAVVPPAGDNWVPVVSASTAGCGAAPATTAALDEVANRLRSTAQTDFANSFTELEITDRVRVFRKADTSFDAWVVGKFSRDCVELIDVPYSGRENQALKDRVDADREYWAGKGISINTLSMDVTGILNVDVADVDIAEVRAMMSDRYKRPVQVTEQDAIQLPLLRPS